jgi:hypothetical protein
LCSPPQRVIICWRQHRHPKRRRRRVRGRQLRRWSSAHRAGGSRSSAVAHDRRHAGLGSHVGGRAVTAEDPRPGRDDAADRPRIRQPPPALLLPHLPLRLRDPEQGLSPYSSSSLPSLSPCTGSSIYPKLISIFGVADCEEGKTREGGGAHLQQRRSLEARCQN